ncbi:MAG: DUF2029 domain-containing protein [Nitrospirales bacterium]|nr:DUF2029 domain-containing protein [Nitrospira sp.]MDR4501769.1 DUF2029 domain-containing protein [Nitrospirales bacterium]
MGGTQASKTQALWFIGFTIAFAVLVFWDTAYVWTMAQFFHMNDFGKFYYATVAFLDGQDMYGPSLATFIQLTDDYGQQFWNLNPPHFHLLLLPLAYLPPLAALLAWHVLNFSAFLLIVRWIKQELNYSPSVNQTRVLVIGFLAFAGTGAHLVTGQFSFLLALPVTIAWIHTRHHEWNKAGIYLGIACSLKLFLLIFLPYFFFKRQYGAIGRFLGVLGAAFGIGVAVFGIAPHVAWIEKISEINWHWAGMNGSLWGILSRTLIENPMYQIAHPGEFLVYPAWVILSAFCGGIALYIAANDSSPGNIDRAFAILIISAILISPLGWTYYLFLLLGPLTGLLVEMERDTDRHEPRWARRIRTLQILLACGIIPGLLVPLIRIPLADSSFLVTLTIGSAYFWSIFLFWIFLVLDWKMDHRRDRITQAVSPA